MIVSSHPSVLATGLISFWVLLASCGGGDATTMDDEATGSEGTSVDGSTGIRDRADHRLERRPPVQVAEGAGLDLLHDDLQAAPDRPEILEPLLPEKPGLVRASRVRTPALEQDVQGRRHG